MIEPEGLAEPLGIQSPEGLAQPLGIQSETEQSPRGQLAGQCAGAEAALVDQAGAAPRLEPKFRQPDPYTS